MSIWNVLIHSYLKFPDLPSSNDWGDKRTYKVGWRLNVLCDAVEVQHHEHTINYLIYWRIMKPERTKCNFYVLKIFEGDDLGIRSPDPDWIQLWFPFEIPSTSEKKC